MLNDHVASRMGEIAFVDQPQTGLGIVGDRDRAEQMLSCQLVYDGSANGCGGLRVGNVPDLGVVVIVLGKVIQIRLKIRFPPRM